MRGLTDEMWTFVKKHFDSVEQLEILLLLQRNPDADWRLEALSKELRTNVTSARNRLAALVSTGLVVTAKTGSEDTYRYGAASPELDRQVQQLVQEYKIRRVRIIDAIYAPAAEKMLTFLDAFKIRKTNKDD